jgi:hypothetical protein
LVCCIPATRMANRHTPDFGVLHSSDAHGKQTRAQLWRGSFQRMLGQLKSVLDVRLKVQTPLCSRHKRDAIASIVENVRA